VSSCSPIPTTHPDFSRSIGCKPAELPNCKSATQPWRFAQPWPKLGPILHARTTRCPRHALNPYLCHMNNRNPDIIRIRNVVSFHNCERATSLKKEFISRCELYILARRLGESPRQAQMCKCAQMQQSATATRMSAINW
jgi:hypothetical protein